MRCPSCNGLESKVVDSRPVEDGLSIRRRRECLNCGRRFTTYERLGESPLVVIKSDGTSEVYNREKLLRGVYIACAKRRIAPHQIEHLVEDVEREMRNNNLSQVQSKSLGEMVMERLKSLDEVAYIRFASVYEDFQTVEEFKQAIKGL